MADEPKEDREQDYVIETCVPRDLTAAEIATCVAIVSKGEAVRPKSMERELPLAGVLAVVRKGRQIVGVGAIKRVRARYAETIANRSGESFPADTPELGYVALDPRHRGNHLSPRIVAALLAKHRGPLFATTDCDRMKSGLSKAGFVRKGGEWEGGRDRLSLWLKH